jgi:hypothetical protein
MKSILVQLSRMNKVRPTDKNNDEHIDLSIVTNILDESSDARSADDNHIIVESDVGADTSHEKTENDENISNTVTDNCVNYFCENCKYSTKYKWVFDTHKKSKKHLLLLHDENTFQHVCKFCTQKYKSKYGLSRHYRNCITKNQSEKTKKQEEISKLHEKIRAEIHAQLCI